MSLDFCTLFIFLNEVLYSPYLDSKFYSWLQAWYALAFYQQNNLSNENITTKTDGLSCFLT